MTKIKTFDDDTDPTPEERRAFLEALTALSYEHGIYIAGDGACGCCGATSPHLQPIRSSWPKCGRYAESELAKNFVIPVSFDL